MAFISLYQNVKGIPNEIEVGDRAYHGGEGDIYFTKDGLYAIKIYHTNKVGIAKKRFLEMITVLGNSLTQEEAAFLCWPLALIRTVDGTQQMGCVTRRIPESYKTLIHLNYNPPKAKEQFQAGKSWSHYLQIARGIARAVSVLHGRGCAHTDLSGKNFLVDPENCDVVLLDLDGLVVQGFLPAQVVGTMGIIAREVMLETGKPDEISDRHSLAVQILQTLLFRNVFQPLATYDPDPDRDEEIGWGEELTFSEDPRNRCNRPRSLGVPLFNGGALTYKMLTPALQVLTERACIEGINNPAKRPSAREWINTLSYALDELYRCSRCRKHFPYPYWLHPVQRRICPFCGQRISGNLPSVLSLYEPRSRGKYIFAQRHLVMGNGWQLFSDILDPQRNPPMIRQNELSVGHVEWDDKNKNNRLVNDEDSAWRIRLGKDEPIQIISRGASIPLRPGATIHFGESRRLIVVSE